MPKRKVCGICGCLCGTHQHDVRPLPGSEHVVVEEPCVNKKLHALVSRHKIAAEVPRITATAKPEENIDRVTSALVQSRHPEANKVLQQISVLSIQYLGYQAIHCPFPQAIH